MWRPAASAVLRYAPLCSPPLQLAASSGPVILYSLQSSGNSQLDQPRCRSITRQAVQRRRAEALPAPSCRRRRLGCRRLVPWRAVRQRAHRHLPLQGQGPACDPAPCRGRGPAAPFRLCLLGPQPAAAGRRGPAQAVPPRRPPPLQPPPLFAAQAAALGPVPRPLPPPTLPAAPSDASHRPSCSFQIASLPCLPHQQPLPLLPLMLPPPPPRCCRRRLSAHPRPPKRRRRAARPRLPPQQPPPQQQPPLLL